MLGRAHHNVCVVGDSNQCLPPGTLVATPSGPVPIEALVEGDRVCGTGGRTELLDSSVAAAVEGHYDGPFVEVRARRSHPQRHSAPPRAGAARLPGPRAPRVPDVSPTAVTARLHTSATARVAWILGSPEEVLQDAPLSGGSRNTSVFEASVGEVEAKELGSRSSFSIRSSLTSGRRECGPLSKSRCSWTTGAGRRRSTSRSQPWQRAGSICGGGWPSTVCSTTSCRSHTSTRG